jgi:hypothetical protein
MDASPEMAIAVAVMAAMAKSLTSDAWDGFKKAFSKILGRGNKSETNREEAELDRDREKLLAIREKGDIERAKRMDAKWSLKIEEFLEDHPECADEFRAMAEEYGAESSAAAASQTVINRNISMDNSRIISGGIGDVHVTLPPGEG